MPPKRQATRKEDTPSSPPQSPSHLPTPAVTDTSLRMSYRIARGEQGVLSFEPYKSYLLPHWRFRTPAIARASAEALWRAFTAYAAAGDFVGMDMVRKFVQMGMTRARRYANYKGGRKYARAADGGRGAQVERSKGHKGRADKAEASDVFRDMWARCRAHEDYQRLKQEFLAEQKVWDAERARREEEEENKPM